MWREGTVPVPFLCPTRCCPGLSCGHRVFLGELLTSCKGGTGPGTPRSGWTRPSASTVRREELQGREYGAGFEISPDLRPLSFKLTLLCSP